MKAWLRQWWIGLSLRERAATSAAAGLAFVVLLYVAAIEPAWRARVRLAAELPRLRTEAAELDALAAEAKKLKPRAPGVESPGDVKGALTRLLAAKSIVGNIRETDDQRLVLSVRRADAAAWLAWMRDASTELPLRVSAARIARVGPGIVDAEVTLTPAGQK